MVNHGIVLIPAFSISRTQELLYELEELLGQYEGCGGSLSERLNEATQSRSSLIRHWYQNSRMPTTI